MIEVRETEEYPVRYAALTTHGILFWSRSRPALGVEVGWFADPVPGQDRIRFGVFAEVVAYPKANPNGLRAEVYADRPGAQRVTSQTFPDRDEATARSWVLREIENARKWMATPLPSGVAVEELEFEWSGA